MVKIFTNLFLALTFSLSMSSVTGQKDIYLSVNQYIGGAPFALGNSGTNDLGTKFSVSRMDYFISSIILHHDGGISTKVADKYMFVTKGQKVNEFLGNFNVNALDSITFSIGVDSVNNHADPTLWPANHPLAPKSPDMHWGWAAGYRFVAMEGKTGSALEYDYEIHPLGDELYHPTTLVTQGVSQNGKITVEIDAHYEHALKGIFMDRNLFVHGNFKEAVYMMMNFNKSVFKVTQSISSSDNFEIEKLKIYPNPANHGKFTLELTEDEVTGAQYIVRDVIGRVLVHKVNPALTNEISINNAGVYFVEVLQSGRTISRGKVIIQ
jgi:hypothetical protein